MDKQNKIVISHPTGNESVRHAVYGLYKANLLDSFHTCVACFKGSILYKLSSLHIFSGFKRRMFVEYIRKYTHTYPLKEMVRILKREIGKSGAKDVDNIYHDLDYKVSKYLHSHKRIKAVYAYDEGAYYSFLQAKKNGILCFFDLPIVHWRTYQKLLNEEKDKNKQWASVLGIYDDSKEKLERKDKELLLADRIYVASNFTKQSIMEDFPYTLKAPIIVIPYGFPDVNKNRIYIPFNNRKLKFLYVGRLSQSKGLSYLFESIAPFTKDIDLTLVGSGNIDDCIVLKEQIMKHTYIPYLPHHKVLSLMAESDVFIFPSLFEGFGMVITEAMSQGTPVITTTRTCGLDFIQDGINGWLVEPGNSQQLKYKIQHIVDNKNDLVYISRKAMETAAKRPWSIYEKELAESINK